MVLKLVCLWVFWGLLGLLVLVILEDVVLFGWIFWGLLDMLVLLILEDIGLFGLFQFGVVQGFGGLGSYVSPAMRPSASGRGVGVGGSGRNWSVLVLVWCSPWFCCLWI